MEFWTIDNFNIICRLYVVSGRDGRVLARLDIQGGDNCDWEDLAVGPGPIPGQSYIYIGDIGGNSWRSCR